MAEKQKTAEELIKTIVTKLNEIADVNEGWGKAVQFSFSDINVGYYLKLAMNGTVEKCDKKPASEMRVEDAEGTVILDVDTLKGILDKTVDPMEALGKGLLRIEGKMDALMKLAPVIM